MQLAVPKYSLDAEAEYSHSQNRKNATEVVMEKWKNAGF